MTQAAHKTEPRWAELSDEVLASVEAGRTTAIEAVRKFIDEVTPVLADGSRRKTVIDAALNLAEELLTTRIEFLRNVIRSAAETDGKE
ncbi:hypothetical protein [Mycobacterium sp.]|uniref:hypothetical protein n=1 Tax=Mycobacterium sp. TaxID=1785 RepID=UPI002D042619|nr:hypothetical protein [Mycobacterium sp.]HME48497.1 hypothetical protein [Mycobacterium sp.]